MVHVGVEFAARSLSEFVKKGPVGADGTS